MMANVAFLGLGAMGARMAANLIGAGHSLTVWNRDVAKAAPLARAGARVAATPREAAGGADFVIAMLRDDEASRVVWTDPQTGALAGMMGLNPIMGDQYRLQESFPAGAGFVGIAVSLMGRNHPVGIIFAAILFGMLWQGGAELAFDMPNISRDMIVVIQGLVILFAGALEHMYRPALAGFFNRRDHRTDSSAVPGTGEAG